MPASVEPRPVRLVPRPAPPPAVALAAASTARTPTPLIRTAEPAPHLPIWREAFAWYDWWLLRTSAVYFGLGVPQGDGSAVVTIPGFLATDTYLRDFRTWLKRLGYRPYHSGIGRNAECPNTVLARLMRTIDAAYADTARRVHLIGHSLGGVLARSAGAQRPDRVASVTVLGSPFRGIRSHPVVMQTHDVVRRIVLGRESGQFLPPGCYTGQCTCAFVEALDGFPPEVAELAIYSRSDGIVDWRMCVTGDASKDREVLGTHVGLAANPFVYRHVAEFLAAHAQARRDVA
jgi:pimeloyl-ACP methyl ester carboxylesterase